jgi:hypothetical protein
VRYMLMCFFEEDRWADLPEALRQQVMQDYITLIREIGQSGRLLGSVKLRPSTVSTTVRECGGKLLITDGPFAETREQLGGYHLVECENLDEALAIAQRIPTVRAGGSIEVRPVEETYA